MTKPTAWSYSSLSLFQQCPYKYYRLRIEKDTKEPESEAMAFGNAVHKSAELAIKKGTPIPREHSFMEPYVAPILKLAGTKEAELRLGLTAKFKPCGFFDRDVWWRGIADVVVVNGEKALSLDWKGLDIATPIPTPTGWSTMADLRVGDSVFAQSGEPCTVRGKSEVKHLRCYKVVFDDKTSIVCDAEHLWPLMSGVTPIEDIAQSLPTPRGGGAPLIPTAQPLQLPEVELPIHPYVLGLWLGDGRMRRGEICHPDPFVWEEIVRCGYSVTPPNTASLAKRPARASTVRGLTTQLRALGLTQGKHIPAGYLRAGYSQRLALLQGLMDSDGNANPARKTCVFTSCDKRLSDDTLELLRTLGQRPKQHTTTQRGFGLTVTAYPIEFRPIRGIKPFRLPRKAERISPEWGDGKSWRRRIVAVEEVPSRPTQCIAVDSVDNTYLCGPEMVPTHNTGSAKYPDVEQLEMVAIGLFYTYPEVQEVTGGLAFVVHKKTVPYTLKRDQVPDKLPYWLGETERLDKAVALDKWVKRPNFTCKGWCPVEDCPYWEPKRRRR